MSLVKHRELPLLTEVCVWTRRGPGGAHSTARLEAVCQEWGAHSTSQDLFEMEVLLVRGDGRRAFC